jgi:hypothetical protein
VEEWKDVVGYEGIYQVSSLGRVMRVAGGHGATPGRIMKPMRDGNGYLQVSLYRDRKRARLYVHRMVAIAFLGQQPPGCEVNHKNGDRDDPRAENLEWVTRSENHRHAYRVLGREAAPSKGEAHGRSKLTRDDVKRIRMLYATGEYLQAELGEMFGVTGATIGQVVRRETWKHVP